VAQTKKAQEAISLKFRGGRIDAVENNTLQLFHVPVEFFHHPSNGKSGAPIERDDNTKHAPCGTNKFHDLLVTAMWVSFQ
jgi:hypothetical protein